LKVQARNVNSDENYSRYNIWWPFRITEKNRLNHITYNSP
jgi:hypothetical protein